MATDAAARVGTREKLSGIYLIVNEGGSDPLAVASAGVGAGIRVVQYRAKRGIVADRLRALRKLTRAHDALLIVNDDWRAALAFDCDGVHLGPDDEGFANVAPVRAELRDRLIGLSCGSVAEARAAHASGVDYIGAGCVFPTASKDDAGAPIGIGGLLEIARATRLPVAAIGGITAGNLVSVRDSGVAMAAVIAAVAADPDPGGAAARLVELWSGGR